MSTFVSNMLSAFRSHKDVRETRFAATLAALLLSTVILAAGCQTAPKVALPKVVSAAPTSTDLVNVLNERAKSIRKIYAPNGHVGLQNMPGSATGVLAYEGPDKFRIMGTSGISGRVIDCGSDGQTFWYWFKFDDERRVYTCKTDQFHSSGAAQRFPLEPAWFPEALGIINVTENDVMEEPAPSRLEAGVESLRMKIKRQRPDGVYTEYLYFEPLTAAILRQDVVSPSGLTVVTIRCREHQLVDNIVMPKRLEIKCADYDAAFTVDLGTPVLNSEENKIAFVVPTDMQVVDLSKESVANSTSASAAPNGSNEPPAVSPTSDGGAIDASQYSQPVTTSGITPFPTSNQAADQDRPAQNPIAYEAQIAANPAVAPTLQSADPASAPPTLAANIPSNVSVNTAVPQTSYQTQQPVQAPRADYGGTIVGSDRDDPNYRPDNSSSYRNGSVNYGSYSAPNSYNNGAYNPAPAQNAPQPGMPAGVTMTSVEPPTVQQQAVQPAATYSAQPQQQAVQPNAAARQPALQQPAAQRQSYATGLGDPNAPSPYVAQQPALQQPAAQQPALQQPAAQQPAFSDPRQSAAQAPSSYDVPTTPNSPYVSSSLEPPTSSDEWTNAETSDESDELLDMPSFDVNL